MYFWLRGFRLGPGYSVEVELEEGNDPRVTNYVTSMVDGVLYLTFLKYLKFYTISRENISQVKTQVFCGPGLRVKGILGAAMARPRVPLTEFECGLYSSFIPLQGGAKKPLY